MPERRIRRLLDDFYRSRESSGDIRLRWEDGRLQAGDDHDGLESVRRRVEAGALAGEDLRRLGAILASRQKEMRDFTEFLKERRRGRP